MNPVLPAKGAIPYNKQPDPDHLLNLMEHSYLTVILSLGKYCSPVIPCRQICIDHPRPGIWISCIQDVNKQCRFRQPYKTQVEEQRLKKSGLPCLKVL